MFSQLVYLLSFISLLISVHICVFWLLLLTRGMPLIRWLDLVFFFGESVTLMFGLYKGFNSFKKKMSFVTFFRPETI
jgi:hypothetical protein